MTPTNGEPPSCDICADGDFLAVGECCMNCSRSVDDASDIETGVLAQSSSPPYNWGRVASVNGSTVVFESGASWEAPPADAGTGVITLL